jgi:hypothetical protein
MDDFSDSDPEVRRAMVYFVLMLERVRMGQPARQPGDREALNALTGCRRRTG